MVAFEQHPRVGLTDWARKMHPNSMLAQMLTVRETARSLGVSEGAVYQRIRAGKLTAYHFKGRTLLKACDII